MPAKSNRYWKKRAEIGQGATWYVNKWKDWYSKTIIKHSFKRVSKYFKGKRVLDAGCGDCWFDKWLIEKFDCHVLGVDYFDFRPEYSQYYNLEHCPGVDIEMLENYEFIRKFKPEVVVVCSVLECTKNWEKALGSIMKAAPVVVLFEDLRVKSPAYQVGLNYKTAITWWDFLVCVVNKVRSKANELKKAEDIIVESFPANIVDRAFFVHTPRWLWWLVAPITLLIDMIAQHVNAEWILGYAIHKMARFRMVVIRADEKAKEEKGKYSHFHI